MALNIIIDIILVGILIAGAAIGIVKGFVKVVSKPLKPILALVIAFSLASPVATGIVEPIINEPVANQISGFLYENCSQITPDNLQESLPTLVRFAATLAGIDVDSLIGEDGDIIAVLVENLVTPIVHIVAVAASFVLVYILSRLLLWLLFMLIDAVFNAGVFKAFNKILGFLTCFLLAIFAAWSFVSVFEYVIHFPALAETQAVTEFSGGFVYNFFKQYNPVELLLSF